jgi:gamma-glutamylcysteine synthetase
LNLVDIIQQLKPYGDLLKGKLMGLEKEGLRVSRKGGISQASHPKALGCALTHPNITTEYSESLIELLTPPMPLIACAILSNWNVSLPPNHARHTCCPKILIFFGKILTF